MNINELVVLVVEDDAFQRQLIVSMLSTMGICSIAQAENGKQALDIIQDENFSTVDMVICDLNMPEMDGLELLRHLSRENFHPTVIIASSLDNKLLDSAGRMARMYGIRLLGTLQKPLSLVSFKELLEKHELTEKKWNSPVTSREFSLDEILRGLRMNQFEPFFQPKVDLKSGRLTGAEALARWIHPEFGVLSPYVFVPLLEQSGYIDELTFKMLEKSAMVCRALHDDGHILTISVNLSLNSLNEPTLANRIIQTVRTAGIDPHYIILEITESAAMTDVAQALENLTRLCMHGFVLSIDDYGTGYSSMQQLTRIAFGELKIDQSFIQDFSNNPALRIVVESSIDMAHKLQVKSVAEGVETQHDWDMLQSIGCDSVQGYFIAKPLNLNDFNDFIANYTVKVVPTVSSSEQLKPRILVVDDDAFVRGIIIRVLRDLGYENAVQADSASSALKLLESGKFDLIMTDLEMPEISGLEFVQLIRSGKTHARADIRVLILTGVSNTESLGIAMALDVNGFLVKPLIPAMLDEKITKAFSEKLNLRPPLAYQSVMTTVVKPPLEAGTLPVSSKPAVVLTLNAKEHLEVEKSARQLSLSMLRPGMVLMSSICTKDGNKLLNAGHVFSESSINRLNDLSNLLQSSLLSVASGVPG